MENILIDDTLAVLSGQSGEEGEAVPPEEIDGSDLLDEIDEH